MKLNNIEIKFGDFAGEMAKLKNAKHFDYLVTIVGEDFGVEALSDVYIYLRIPILMKRISVKTIARRKTVKTILYIRYQTYGSLLIY